MKKKRGDLMYGLGARLKQLREKFDLSTEQMAARLGVGKISYYKNETDTTMPGMLSLHKLHQDFGVSMDWLLFEHGPPFLAERKAQAAAPAETPPQEELSPDIEELVAHMSRDAKLRYEILLHFHNYKSGQEDEESKNSNKE